MRDRDRDRDRDRARDRGRKTLSISEMLRNPSGIREAYLVCWARAWGSALSHQWPTVPGKSSIPWQIWIESLPKFSNWVNTDTVILVLG